MNRMYTLISTYDDGFSKSETCDSFAQALAAAQIYIQDQECVGLLVVDIEDKSFPLDWARKSIEQAS